MARHCEPHAERRNSLGMGDLAVQCAEHTVEELRPTAGGGIQARNKKECGVARRVWAFPRNYSRTAAGLSDSILRRHTEYRSAQQWQVPWAAVRGQSELQDGTVRVCEFAISHRLWYGPALNKWNISRCHYNFSIYGHYHGTLHSRFHMRILWSFRDCPVCAESSKPIRRASQPGAGIRATARYVSEHQRAARSRRAPGELLQCESAGSEHNSGTTDAS